MKALPTSLLRDYEIFVNLRLKLYVCPSSRFMTVSTLTFPITANMSGAVLECEASHEAEQVSRTVSTKLR